MGTKERLTGGDPYVEATALELWGAGELHDEGGSRSREAVVSMAMMTGFLVGLAAFFLAFAPGT